MATESKLKRFWRWFAPNPLWEFVRWIGGSSVLTGLWGFLSLEYHKSPIDWWFIGIPLCVGLVLAVFGTWKERTSQGKTVQEAAREFANDENYKTYMRMGMQAARMFKPLQMDAFDMAWELGTFLNTLGEKPWKPEEAFPKTVEGQLQRTIFEKSEVEPWESKLKHTYLEGYAQRVSTLTNQFGILGHSDLKLMRLASGVQAKWDIIEIRERLIILAHGLNGIPLEVNLLNAN